MQKILLALDAHDVNTSSVHFASYLANTTKSKLTGVFLENSIGEAALETQTSCDPFGCVHTTTLRSTATIAPVNIDKDVALFKKICTDNDARFSVHELKGKPVKQMVRESRFADVIITHGGLHFSDEKNYGWPSEFVSELLVYTQCPVIISPFYFNALDEIIFAYDGSDSSVFAMKQFTYLFPQFNETRTTLLEVLPEGENEITEKEKLQEWLMMHYDAVHMETLHGKPETELFKNLLTKNNKMLVMGAYGRKIFFNHSTADLLLKTADVAFFITHR